MASNSNPITWAPEKRRYIKSLTADTKPKNLSNSLAAAVKAPGAPVKDRRRNIKNNDDNYINFLDQGDKASPVKPKLVIHLHPSTPSAKYRAKKVSSGRPIKKAKGPVTLCLIGKKVKCNLINYLNYCELNV